MYVKFACFEFSFAGDIEWNFTFESNENDQMSHFDEESMEISTNENQVMLANGHGSLDGEIHCFTSSYAEYPSCYLPFLNAGAPVVEECSEGSDQDGPTREQITKDAIVHAIFQSLDCIDKMGGSLNNFADLLTMARVLYCKGAKLNPDDQDVVKEWPQNWNDAKKCLADVGCSDAKEHFICLNSSHPCHWDILESSNDECRHCGEKGTIPYYYLGLETKVKLWVSDCSMCQRITAHWREKRALA